VTGKKRGEGVFIGVGRSGMGNEGRSCELPDVGGGDGTELG